MSKSRPAMPRLLPGPSARENALGMSPIHFHLPQRSHCCYKRSVCNHHPVHGVITNAHSHTVPSLQRRASHKRGKPVSTHARIENELFPPTAADYSLSAPKVIAEPAGEYEVVLERPLHEDR